MLIHRGITGLQYQDLTSTDEKTFKALCYELCQKLGYRFVRTDFSHIARSFNAVEIERHRGTAFFVLLHVNYDLICFASTIEAFNIHFIDDSSCKEFFESKGFVVLSLTDLDTPCEIRVSKELTDAEMKDINYWKPKTFGELEFNFWD